MSRRSTPSVGGAHDANKTTKRHPRSSRERYRVFVQDYKERRLDDPAESGKEDKPTASQEVSAKDGSKGKLWRGKRREHAREYLGWLRPYRYTIAAVFLCALLAAGLEMVQPLFMRFIIDHVLLNNRS